MNEVNIRIARAVEAIKNLDSAYWLQMLTQRLPGGAGSVVLGDFDAASLEEALLSANWESYSHEAVMEGCDAFSTRDLRGRLGIVELASLPADTVVTLDDRKNTGKVSAVVNGVLGPEVDFTVIILGPEGGVEVVFTFHPGEPVRPSQVQCETGMHGRRVTIAEAQEMGLAMAKVA
jgi:hypothetical protein